MAVLLDFDWERTLDYAMRMLAAFALALPIAWERERATRMMGLRTLPLVAVACCAFILVGTVVVDGDPRAEARILSGLIAGIGFIGGGAILKNDDRVRGTATAASIWSTGVLGAATGHGMLEIAVLISLFTLATLMLLMPIERRMGTLHRPPDADED